MGLVISKRTLVKTRKTFFQIFGGFIIGASLYFLFTLNVASNGFFMGVRFAMFTTLMLLGFSYLGE